MKLHPSLCEVLTGLDADDQDIVERLCRGDWDRVTFEDDGGARHVCVDGRRTVFEVEPEEDPDLQRYFVDGPDITIDLTDEAHPGIIILDVQVPVGATEDEEQALLAEADEHPMPHVVDTDGKRGTCQVCGLRNAERGRTCPGFKDAPRPVVDPDAELCACGCGVQIKNAPGGRKRVYATNACRSRANHAKTKARKEVEAPTTPVVEPAPVAAPASPPPVEDEAPVSEPDAAPVQEQPVEPVDEVVAIPGEVVAVQRLCARCDEPGHFVEDCKYGSRRSAMKAKNGDAPKRPNITPRKGNLAQATEGPRVITCAKCHEPGHSIFTCPKQEDQKTVVVQPLSGEGVSDNDLTAHNHRLRDLCKDGLPDRFQYSFLPDVLALYGVDHDLLDACLRSPDRVEIRPESFDKEKRYCVLAFYKGDLETILGMRNPSAPKVIAVYAHSRLEHDTHRVGHTGGGGSKGTPSGLPKNARQVVTRLRAMGGRELEVELDPKVKTVPVTYKGQELGQIATDGDRQTSEADFQRIQRKMAAIDRRVSA